MKNQQKIKEEFQIEKEEMLIWQVIGPLSLLCTFIISAKTPLPYDLYGISLVGLFLSARFHFRGCFYAVLILTSVAIFRHGMGDLDHLWRLGLEGSIACAFFITSLAFQNSSLKLEALHTELKAKKAALAHSEEDLIKTREEAVQKQIAAAEKLDVLQKNLEETVAEKGAFEVLNDVLRKVTALYRGEKESLEEHLTQDKRLLSQTQTEVENLQQEISQLKKSDHEVEKKALLNELNEVRVEKEQSHLINEKLVRLHAKESLKAQVAIEQLQNIIEEKKEVQQQMRAAIGEAEKAMQALQKAEKETKEHQTALDQVGQLHQEKSFLQERIRSAERELSFLKKTPEELEVVRKERDQLAEQLGRAQEKIHFLAKLEPLHKQLRAQFDEKNQILHETRAALFHVDTELQTLRIEREQQNLQLHVVPEALCSELIDLDREIASLAKENENLQGLVSHLMEQMPHGQNSLKKTLDEALSSVKRKKRSKSREQDLLF